MRQVDIHIRKDDAELVERVVKAFEPVDWSVLLTQQKDRVLVRVVLRAGRSQQLIDAIQEALEQSSHWRVTVLHIESALPQPDALEEEEAQRNMQVMREELFDDVQRDAALTYDFIIMVTLSTIVAAVGLNVDSIAAVIGAMVIAPLLSPILGFSLGAGLGNLGLIRQSGVTLIAGIATALAVAFLVSLVIPTNTESRELMSRAEVRLDGMALGLAAGGAAALSMARQQSTGLVGVMVAAALLPPGAAFGLFLGAGYWEFAFRAGLLLCLNVSCLILAALVVFRLKNIKPRGWIEQRNADRATIINLAASVIFLVIFVTLIIVLDLGQAVEISEPGESGG